MPQNNNTQWPLPKFNFAVSFGTTLTDIPFQEASGMDSRSQVIEYRHGGNNPVFSAIKMPGIVKHGNVTLKRGLFTNAITFGDWYKAITTNTIAKCTIVVKLLDEAGQTAMEWTLNNAWPTKISSTDLKSEGNEVAVESLEVAFETMIISAGQ
jgi:phage tail-like protein